MLVAPDSLEFDACGLELEAIGQELWAIDTDANPGVEVRRWSKSK